MKITTEQFVMAAKKVHREIYDYSSVQYVSAKTKVRIVCRKHGEFTVTPDNHLRRSSGCPECGNIVRGEKASLRLKGVTHDNFAGSVCKRRDDFLSRSRAIHGDRYDYSFVEYKSGKKFVKLICKNHGIFKMLPSRHLRGDGCVKCTGEERRKKTQLEFVDHSMRIHGDKYDYSKVVYQVNNKPIILVCPLHGKFQQRPNHHLRGQGCHKCRSSHGERLIGQWLTKTGVGFEEQKMFTDCINPVSGFPLKFDFYIPSLNICVEFDGEQHFRPWRNGKMSIEQVEKIKFRDNIKDCFCKSNGIRLVRISYLSINNVPDILAKELAA